MKDAVKLLDELDPILGYDILFANGDEGMIRVIYHECQERANVHSPGTLRNKWNDVLDILGRVIA